MLSQKKSLGWDNCISIILVLIIILIPLVFYKYSLPTFEPAKNLALYSLAVIAFTLVSLKFIITEHLSWQKTELDKPLFMYLLYGSLSLLWSVNIYHSILTLPMFFVGPVLFFIITNSIREQKKINILLLAIIFVGTLMGTYGILQYMGIDFQMWVGNVGRSQVMGLFGNVNYFAEYLISPLTLSVGLFLSKEKLLNRFFLFLSVIIIGTTLLVTFTRGSYLAVGISISVMLLLYHKSASSLSDKRYYKRIILYGLLLVIIALSIVFIPHPLNQENTSLGRLRSRVTPEALTSGHNALRRMATWQYTWMMIKDRFILGSGLGTFEYLSLKYQADFFTLNGNRDVYPHGFAGEAHNEYLQTWSELGLIGFLLFLSIIVIFYRLLFWNLKEMTDSQRATIISLSGGVTAVLIDAIFGFPFQLPASLSLFWIFFGLAIAQIITANQKKIEPIEEGKHKASKIASGEKVNQNSRRIPFRKVLLSFFVAAISVVLIVLLIRPFMAHIYWYHGNKQLNGGRKNAAIGYFEEALKWNPWQGQMYYFIGNILTDGHITQLALEYYHKAEKFIDYHYLSQNIAENYLRQGKVNQAIPYLEKAIQYQSSKERMLQFQLRLGNIYLTQKDYQNAEKIFNSAIHNKPDSAELYYGLAQAYIGISNEVLAKETLQKVINLAPASKVAGYAGTLLKKFELQNTISGDTVE